MSDEFGDKIDNRRSDSTYTTYKIYGYSNLILNSNQVNFSSLKSEEQYSDYNSFDSLLEVLDNLKSEYS